jgi:hypothetical protein
MLPFKRSKEKVIKDDFFDKKYILILRRYQLHSASATTQYSNSITDAHSQKKKENYIKEKSRYDIPVLATMVQPPTRQHLNSRHSKSDASKKVTVHKHHHHPIRRS